MSDMVPSPTLGETGAGSSESQQLLEAFRAELAGDPEVADVLSGVMAMAGPWFAMLAGSEENGVHWIRRGVEAWQRAERRVKG